MNLSDQFTSIQLERDDPVESRRREPEADIEEEHSDVASDDPADSPSDASNDVDSDDLMIPQGTENKEENVSGPKPESAKQPSPSPDEHKPPPEYSEEPPHQEADEPPALPRASTVAAATAPKSKEPTIEPSPELKSSPEPSPEPETAPEPAKPQIDYTKYFEDYKLESEVSSPIKDMDAQSKPFMNYLITTKTNNPLVLKLNRVDEDKEIELSTRRRYGDFRYLHDSLSKDYPTVLIPPLPSKSNLKYLTGDTFSPGFIHKRLESLDTFVHFITNHRVLSQSSVFHLFISDLPDWVTFTKSLKLRDVDDGASFGRDELTETFMNFLTPSKYKQETNKDILEISDKLKRLYENLLRLDRLFSKLNKKHADLAHDYGQFSHHVRKLSTVASEGAEGEAPDGAMVANFTVFADALDFFATSWQSLHTYVDESFLVSLKNCSKYIISLTDLIQLQHNKKIDLQVLQDYHNRAQADLVALGGGGNHQAPTPVYHHTQGLVGNTAQLIKDTLSTSASGNISSTATDAKVAKVQSRIDQLAHEISVQTQLVNDLTTNIVQDEYPNWDRFNRGELKKAMLGLCTHQIGFYNGLIDNWSQAEQKLLKRLDELGETN
ncbi:sorting nexin-4 [Diutina catenulata]